MFFVWCGSGPVLCRCFLCRRNANLAGRFAFLWGFFPWFALFVKPKGFILFVHFFPLLSLSGPSLRARSAATEEKKTNLRLQKTDAPSFSSKQSSHQTKRKNKKLPSPSTGFKQQPICTPLAPTRNQIIYKTISSDGPPILGPENLLKTGFAQKGLPVHARNRHRLSRIILTHTSQNASGCSGNIHVSWHKYTFPCVLLVFRPKAKERKYDESEFRAENLKYEAAKEHRPNRFTLSHPLCLTFGPGVASFLHHHLWTQLSSTCLVEEDLYEGSGPDSHNLI